MQRRGTSPPLSAEVLYWVSKQLDGDDEPGTGMDSVSVALRRTGQPDARICPYRADRPARPAFRPPPEALAADQLKRATATPLAQGAAALHDELAAGRCPVVLVWMWEQLREPRGSELEVPLGVVLGDEVHAMVVVARDHERGLLLRNSWGRSWGDDGHAWLRESDWPRVRVGAYRVLDDVDP